MLAKNAYMFIANVFTPGIKVAPQHLIHYISLTVL